MKTPTDYFIAELRYRRKCLQGAYSLIIESFRNSPFGKEIDPDQAKADRCFTTGSNIGAENAIAILEKESISEAFFNKVKEEINRLEDLLEQEKDAPIAQAFIKGLIQGTDQVTHLLMKWAGL